MAPPFDPCNPCDPCAVPRNRGITITNGAPTGAPGVMDLPIAYDAAGAQLYGWTPTDGWFPIAPVIPGA